MQVIRKPSDNILKILGAPKADTGGLRWMTYVQALPVAGGVLLFHTLTRALLLLTEAEYATPQGIPALREQWFLVPEALADRAYADKVRFVLTALQKRPTHITGYTVFTTMDCNARCFYCFERGRPRTYMSAETAHRAAAYIAAHIGGETAQLAWFGGEPLLGREMIDIICADLAAAGVSYTSSMISNGYLFDADNVQRAVSHWKLRHVQITLDGTEAVYNRCKAYVYRDGRSPYRVVTDNIGRLLDADIAVTVRMNLDAHNAEDLLRLADALHARFAGRNKLRAYSHVLFEYAGRNAHPHNEDMRRSLYEKQRQLRERLRAYGLLQTRKLSGSLPANMCMADSGRALTVLPDGHLGVCDHYSEDNFVGHIGGGAPDAAVLRRFCARRQPTEACASCTFYPECIRLEKCTEQTDCFPALREDKRQSLLYAMQDAYAAWRQNVAADGGDDADGAQTQPVC